MKESLFDIFNRHTNWATTQNDADVLEEMNQAAALYADSLLPLADRWIKAVENDIEGICTYEPPHIHFNKERRENYKLNVWCFLSVVSASLRSHGFDIGQMDTVTQLRLGQKIKGVDVKENLSRDEAIQHYESMKKQGFQVHCFRELCSNRYTVLTWGRNGKAVTIPPELQTDEAARMFALAMEEGLINERYEWQKGREMLACFAREASLYLGLGKGVDADDKPRISWKPFETLFGIEPNKLKSNLKDVQKRGSDPKEAYLIDSVFRRLKG